MRSPAVIGVEAFAKPSCGLEGKSVNELLLCTAARSTCGRQGDIAAEEKEAHRSEVRRCPRFFGGANVEAAFAKCQKEFCKKLFCEGLMHAVFIVTGHPFFPLLRIPSASFHSAKKFSPPLCITTPFVVARR